MNPGDLFKDTYYIRKKLRTIDECIDVYHITYVTESGDKHAMLFLLDPAFAGTKNGSVKFRSLYLTLRDSGKIKKVLDYSMEGNDYYLIIPATSKQEHQSSEPIDISSAGNILTETGDIGETGFQKKKTSGKKNTISAKKGGSKKESSPSRLLRIEFYVISIVLILCLIFAAGYYLTVYTPEQTNQEEDSRNENQHTDMPDLIGLTINDAIDLLTENNLYYKITYEDSDRYLKDAICRQSVAAGTRIERFSTVDITVSNGSPKPTVSETTGAEETESTAEGEAESSAEQQEPSSAPSGNSGGLHSSHETMEAVPGSCKVPDLTGVWESNAESIITGAGLKLGKIYYEKYDGAERGKIFFQNIKAGDSVAPGTIIDIWVSGQG